MEENKITKAITEALHENSSAFNVITEIAETRFNGNPIYDGGKKSGKQINKAVDSIIDGIFCIFK